MTNSAPAHRETEGIEAKEALKEPSIKGWKPVNMSGADSERTAVGSGPDGAEWQASKHGADKAYAPDVKGSPFHMSNFYMVPAANSPKEEKLQTRSTGVIATG